VIEKRVFGPSTLSFITETLDLERRPHLPVGARLGPLLAGKTMSAVSNVVLRRPLSFVQVSWPF
jgi:hypothetical protein